MTTPNRSARLNKIHKVLKKHYKPVAPADRPLLDHLLYGCCLENASFEAADVAFARLQQSFFDWNEIRVTTIAELAEVMSTLPDAARAAGRLKRTLQTVFETHYSFELDSLKKQNLGKAIAELERFDGPSSFGISYATQHALGGHSIPISQSARHLLALLGVVSAADAEHRRPAGLERTIPKSKGIEFASLLHQLAADYESSPYSTRVRSIILEIDPEAKDRLPKRPPRKEDREADAEPAAASDPAAHVPDVKKPPPDKEPLPGSKKRLPASLPKEKKPALAGTKKPVLRPVAKRKPK